MDARKVTTSKLKKKHTETFLTSLVYLFAVSSEISDLCEISELLLFVSYFAYQNK